MSKSKYCLIASISMVIAISLGAIGAHALEKTLSIKALHTFETGIKYQIYHSLALFFMGLNISNITPQSKLYSNSMNLFILGIILFSGNCILYALTNIKTFAMIVPLGGFSFIGGWICLTIYYLKK